MLTMSAKYDGSQFSWCGHILEIQCRSTWAEGNPLESRIQHDLRHHTKIRFLSRSQESETLTLQQFNILHILRCFRSSSNKTNGYEETLYRCHGKWTWNEVSAKSEEQLHTETARWKHRGRNSAYSIFHLKSCWSVWRSRGVVHRILHYQKTQTTRGGHRHGQHTNEILRYKGRAWDRINYASREPRYDPMSPEDLFWYAFRQTHKTYIAQFSFFIP